MIFPGIINAYLAPVSEDSRSEMNVSCTRIIRARETSACGSLVASNDVFAVASEKGKRKRGRSLSLVRPSWRVVNGRRDSIFARVDGALPGCAVNYEPVLIVYSRLALRIILSASTFDRSRD